MYLVDETACMVHKYASGLVFTGTADEFWETPCLSIILGIAFKRMMNRRCELRLHDPDGSVSNGAWAIYRTCGLV